MMTPDRNINSVPEEEQQSVIVAASAMDPVDLEEGLNQSMDNDEEPTETMEDEPIEGLEEEPIDVTQDDANVTMESGPVETMEDEPGDDEPSLAHINHSINTSVSSENCKIINESDQMHSPCPDPEGANIAVMNSGMDHEAVIPGTANLTPVKLLDPELKEQDTFTSSPTNSRDEHLVDDDEARPLSRRQQRMRVVKCYAMVAIVVLVCAIGIPLGAVMLFKNNNNETSFAGSTGSNNSPSTSTTTVKPDDMRPPESPAVIEDTDAPVVEDEDGSTDPPLFVEDDFETDIPLVNPVATDAPVMVESNTTDFVEEDPLDEIEMNVTSETVPEVEVPVEEEDEVSTSSPTTSPSASPSAAATQRQTPPTTPGPDRSSIYFDLINVTSPAILQDTSTPQALSYLWMVEKDQFLPVPTGRYLIQRYILVVMDHVMHDPIGPGLSQPALDHCLWEGIVCEPETGDIKQINWRLQGLNGRLAEELKHLDSLERLDLSENSLVGNLEVLYDATFLKDVYLHNNRLTGPLTEQIGQLEELESLNLGHNQLTGNIPISLRSSRGEAKPLRWLILSHNRFSGLLPPDWRMRNLFYLDLGHNDLSGPLPSDWDVNMVRLRHLYLDHNQFSGLLPAYFGQIGNGRMKQMHLNDNILEGKVPEEWNPKDQLINMAVHNNRLTVPVASSVCELSVFELGNMVEFRTDCNICTCDFLCEMCSK